MKALEQEVVQEDINDEGKIVNWDVEMWEYANYLRMDSKIIRKTFKTKVEAQGWIQSRIEFGLPISVKVNRLTYDNITYPMLPTRKFMYEKEF